MKWILACLAFAGLLSLMAAQPSQSANADCSPCTAAEEALANYGRLYRGMQRNEVETLFALDGGLQGAPTTRYTHPRCRYIKLDIEFSPIRDAEGRALMTPEDRVTGFSKLYIAYPVAD